MELSRHAPPSSRAALITSAGPQNTPLTNKNEENRLPHRPKPEIASAPSAATGPMARPTGESKLPWVHDLTPFSGALLGQYVLVLKGLLGTSDKVVLDFLISREAFRPFLLAFGPQTTFSVRRFLDSLTFV